MELNNLYDFDKTIFKKDSSFIFYFYLLSRKPWLFFHLIGLCFMKILNVFKIISIEKFKEYTFSIFKHFKNKEQVLQAFVQKNKNKFAKFYCEQKNVDDVICTASPEFLVKALMQTINKDAIVVGSKISFETLKYADGEKNCKGANKIEMLKKHFKQQQISCQNAYSDSLSDIYMFDIAQNGFLIVNGKPALYKNSEGLHKLPFSLSLKTKYLIKMLRIKHYIKNFLMLVPLFFAGAIFNANALLAGLLGFVAFCFLSSFVYIVNDLFDIKKDRNHTTKRLRSLASGIITKFEGIVVAVVLLGTSCLINVYLGNLPASIVSLCYVLLNFLYSFKLKNVPILDLFLLSCCYILRLLYGSLLFSISLSTWLYLVVLCASLFLGTTKRKNEVLTQKADTREVNKKYSSLFLNKNQNAFYILTMAFYALWAMEQSGSLLSRWNSILMLISIPLVFIIFMRYSFLTEKESNSGNPVDVIFQDFVILLLVFVYVVVMTLALYVDLSFIRL
ncbi:MAG: UbiA family prenyltransferase [Christensenellales bacterium]